jgi:hypothetical protein
LNAHIAGQLDEAVHRGNALAAASRNAVDYWQTEANWWRWRAEQQARATKRWRRNWQWTFGAVQVLVVGFIALAAVLVWGGE